MNYKKLDFFTTKWKSGKDVEHRIDYNKAMKILSHAAPGGSDGSVWISSRVSNPIIGFDKYMMILQCSSDAHMFVAANYLKVRNIGYCPIKYPQSGYYIITDEVNNIDHIKDLINTIPGVYGDYKHHFMPYIHAYLKGLESPSFTKDIHTLTNPLVIEWLDAVKAYYSCDDMQKILKIKKMGIALRDGTINDLMANPEFKL